MPILGIGEDDDPTPSSPNPTTTEPDEDKEDDKPTSTSSKDDKPTEPPKSKPKDDDGKEEEKTTSKPEPTTSAKRKDDDDDDEEDEPKTTHKKEVENTVSATSTSKPKTSATIDGDSTYSNVVGTMNKCLTDGINNDDCISGYEKYKSEIWAASIFGAAVMGLLIYWLIKKRSDRKEKQKNNGVTIVQTGA